MNNRVLLVKGVAGLGNRILALLTAALYAELTHRRLYVDWSDAVFAPQGDLATRHINLFEELFQSESLQSWKASMICDDVSPAIWRGHLGMTAANFTRQVAPLHWQDYGACHLTSTNIKDDKDLAQILVYWSWRERIFPMRCLIRECSPSLRKLNDFQILQSLAKRHLRPNVAIEHACEQLLEPASSSPIVGLHIRYSDMRAPVEKLLHATRQAIERLQATQLILATDNVEMEEKVQARFRDMRITLTGKQYGVAGLPLHYDTSCVDRITRAKEALTEMLLLSRSDHLVFASRSSFGYVAHILADPKQSFTDCDRFSGMVQAKRLVQKYWYR